VPPGVSRDTLIANVLPAWTNDNTSGLPDGRIEEMIGPVLGRNTTGKPGRAAQWKSQMRSRRNRASSYCGCEVLLGEQRAVAEACRAAAQGAVGSMTVGSTPGMSAQENLVRLDPAESDASASPPPSHPRACYGDRIDPGNQRRDRTSHSRHLSAGHTVSRTT